MTKTFQSESPNTLADDAIETPTKMFAASTNSSEGRSPGLVLTKEQIISLRLYELAGQQLPTDLTDVENYLGYKNGAGTGLEPPDFQKTFVLIKTHAQRWDPLRAKIKLVGSQLRLFASDMQIYGNSMEEVYKDIKKLSVISEYSIKTLDDVKRLELELGDKFPGIVFDAEDLESTADLTDFLNKIFAAVEQQLNDAKAIQSELDSFGRDLEAHVIPAIQTKVHLIDTSKLPDETKALDQAITARAERIAELDKAYSESVKKSISAALTGVAGLALGIYAGVEAEKIRKERNKLKKDQSRDINLLETKQKILASLHRVKLDLQDMSLVAIDATAATHNLRTVWNALSLYIKSSHDATKEINDALRLVAFMTEFRRVVTPWIKIEQDAGMLLQVFAAADEEMKNYKGDNK